MGPVPFILEVNREAFTLTVKRRSEKAKAYVVRDVHPIAVGMVGHETPAGDYWVQVKVRNPDWLMPNADWVDPEKRGKTIKGGAPENPIKGSFLKLVDDPTGNIGIHGTAALDSLGSRASHGCIRVDPEVALALHRLIPTNTPVRII